MSGKRELLADILFQAGLTPLIGRLIRHDKLVILNYHRIRSSERNNAATCGDKGLFSVDEKIFLLQMRWLKRHTHILSEQDIIHLSETGNWAPANRPSVMITFDDGYHDNYSVAFPILKALQIPAIFFICTAMIGEGRLRWWDVLAYLISTCRKPSICIHQHEYPLHKNRWRVIADFQRQLKPRSPEEIHEFIRITSEACEVDLPSDDLQRRELMHWDHLREMAAQGMTIGSHTHTHQALSFVGDCQSELSVSKNLLEHSTGRPVRSVSYPFGLYEYIPQSISDTARKCGYHLGFTSNFGVNDVNHLNPLALKRFSGDLEKVSKASLIAVWPVLFAAKRVPGQTPGNENEEWL